VIVAGLDALRLKNVRLCLSVCLFPAKRFIQVIQLIFLIFFTPLDPVNIFFPVPNEVESALSPPDADSAVPICRINPNARPDPNLTCFGLTKLYDDVKGFLFVIPIVGGVVSFAMIYLAWKLYGEFGWDIYKKIGADIQLKSKPIALER
jgi:hypothetical protein